MMHNASLLCATADPIDALELTLASATSRVIARQPVADHERAAASPALKSGLTIIAPPATCANAAYDSKDGDDRSDRHAPTADAANALHPRFAVYSVHRYAASHRSRLCDSFACNARRQ